MNLIKLNTFVVFSQERSYSKTANKLNISQPTVSSHISSLEKYYNIELVQRYDGNYKLTSAGKILLEYAENILDLSSELYKVLHQTRHNDDHSIKIVTTSQGMYILPEVTTQLKESNPNLMIYFTVTDTSFAIDYLKKNNDSIALLPANIVEHGLNDNYDSVYIGTDRLFLISSHDNSLSSSTDPITKSDLENQVFLLREAGSNTRHLLDKWAEDNSISLANNFIVGNTEAILQAVAKNIGISLMSNITLKSQSYEYNIIDYKDLPIKRNFYLFVHNKEQFNSNLNNLIIQLRKYFDSFN